MAEQFANFAQSTLASSISASQTTITVANATSFPLQGNFRIVVQMFDSTTGNAIGTPEIMIVTGVAGNQFTVTRGAEGTIAKAYGSGANVTHILTAAVMQALSGGSTIGQPVSGGTPNDILYVDPSGNLGQSNNWTYNQATSAVTLTSMNNKSLTVGPNGATNPVLTVDSSTSGSVTGLRIAGNTANNAVLLQPTSTASSENRYLSSLGGAEVALLVNGVTKKIEASNSQNLFTNVFNTFTAVTSSNTILPRFGFTAIGNSGLASTNELPTVVFNLSAVNQHIAGNITTQRDFLVTNSTHSFTGASTITDAATLAVSGAPIGGTNATITNAHGLLIQAPVLSNTTNGYGATIQAPTGATNNYAAQILGAMRLALVSAPTGKIGGETWYDSTQKAFSYNAAGNTLYNRALLFSANASTTITNTTTETTAIPAGIGSQTIAANSLVAGKTITLLGGGVFSTTGVAPSATVKVKMGSTVLASVTLTNLLGGAANNAFQFNCMITCRTVGATGTVVLNGNINYDTGTLTRGFGALNNSGNTVTIDTTANQTIDVTLTWGAASTSNSLTTTTATMEISG